MIKSIGKHRLRCGDIYDDLSELFCGELMDVMYCDPPWGNLGYWQTLNNKMTGAEKKATDLLSFIKRLAEVAIESTKGDGLVFIEYGMRWKDQVAALFEDAGLVKIGEGTMSYGSPPRPNAILVFDKDGRHEVDSRWSDGVDGAKGYSAVCAALEPFTRAGMSILDPCCGLGYTARYAVEHGMRFFGNELNAKRLERTAGRLS